MEKIYVENIASELGVKIWQVENCIELLESGATIPFISRYRKERTGALDEMQVSDVKSMFLMFQELIKRKETVLKTIMENTEISEERKQALKTEIESSVNPQHVEDLYLPFRPKRKTRASVAKQAGLQPLAEAILSLKRPDIDEYAAGFVNDQVKSADDALAGAMDIIAENFSETAAVREMLRANYLKYAALKSSVVKSKIDEAQKYANYFEFREPLFRIASHRLLAVLRGEEEGFLSVKLDVDEERNIDQAIRVFNSGHWLPKNNRCAEYVRKAAEDSYKRLLHPSIQNEVLKISKKKADLESIRVFGENLTQLLLAPPVGQKRTLAIDPGFRTGCKVVCLDAQGALLHNDTIFPHPPRSEKVMSMKKISNMVQSYKIEVIAIGNGTASRETEAFIKKIALPEGVRVYSVSEDGASVYSASQVARDEFPEYDVTVRGAVSIGRRLMDPLAELVKIDPKSLGIGQYQHDVDQNLLKEKLDEVVVSAVNRVGVNLNTASVHLLSYVSGIGKSLAKNIVEYRDEHGAFQSRGELLKVNRLGDKVYEQAAGFLRVPQSENPLDNSAVHPEQYDLVRRMALDLNLKLSELIGHAEKVSEIDLSRYLSEGEYTVRDIVSELAKPGRDPRSVIKVFEFSESIHSIEDLVVGMELPGIITNITNFGAFVDLGIHENGLIHVSALCPGKRVEDPTKFVKLHQHVLVEVKSVDLDRKRIGLTLKKTE